MELIVAVSEDWGIGKNNSLLFSIPEDMRFFREKTRGAAVIMGRSTLESFPGGKPLRGRVNIVMSTRPDYAPEGVIVVRSVEEAICAAYKSGRDARFVIGGESIYRLFLPYCERAYVTKIHARAEADRFFPNLDEEPDWALEHRGDTLEHEGVEFEFCTYVNLNLTEVGI